MNFDFVTPQLSTNKMLKSGSVESLGKDSGDQNTLSNIFVNKLHQILARNGIKQNVVSVAGTANDLTDIKATQLTGRTTTSKFDISSESLKSDLLKDMNRSQGFEFLTKLKQYLMASDYSDLKGVDLGADGLDAIKAMLVKAGFNPSQVAELIKRLKSESDDGNVLVSDLMNGLLSLDPEDISMTDSSSDMDGFSVEKQTDKEDDLELNDQDGASLLDVSAIPFISSIMTSLGIPDDLITSIVADSELKGEGVGINSLIAHLQELQKNSFFTGKTFQNSSDADSIKGMFKQLGLSAETGSGKGTVDLGDFVSALEGLRQNGASKQESAQIVAGLLEGGLNQSSKSAFSLIASLENKSLYSQENQVAGVAKLEGGDVESDTLIKKFMGDLHINNNLSVKSTEASQPTASEMNYHTLKNVNHQLLMNLSVAQQDGEDVVSALLETDSARMMEKLNLLSGQSGEKSNTASNAILENIISSQENMNKTKSKNSSDLLNEMLEKKIMNLSQVQDEQNAKSASDIVIGKATGNGEAIPDLINLINNSEAQTYAKKSGHSSRVNNSENGLDSILSRVEKKEFLNIFDSNQSGSSFSGGNNTKDGASGLLKEKSTSPLLPSYVTNQVGKSIARALSRGESEIKLQLRPAELGRIFMTIETLGDTLKVSIVTENQSAKDILTGNASELKAAMASNGINIEIFDVEMGSDFKQSMADSGQHSNSSSDSGRKRGSGQSSSISTGEVEGAVVPNFLKNEDGVLHFVA